MREADVRARIASQATDAERRAAADVVVANDTDLATLQARTDRLWEQIGSWARSSVS
jgi:dephospho-CoA kinase